MSAVIFILFSYALSQGGQSGRLWCSSFPVTKWSNDCGDRNLQVDGSGGKSEAVRIVTGVKVISIKLEYFYGPLLSEVSMLENTVAGVRI